MLSTAIARCLPYSAEQLFDLAADIERYPQFLRWWITARVRERTEEHCSVDNTVALGPLPMRFRSEALLLRPKRIEVTSEEAPFRRFRLCWEFEPQPDTGCRVSLSVELELRSFVLQRLAEHTAGQFIQDILLAFEARAHALYASSAASPRAT